MSEKNYHPEEYWSKVGERIESREDGKNVIAGDDEPYYRYKRDEFLKLLRGVDFSGKNVVEIGCGPGGNLQEIYKLKPAKLTGCDISAQMISLSKAKLPTDVNLVKINGKELPFEDKTFDISFTATVLQHNTDDAMMRSILKEICRTNGNTVYLFERIENSITGDELCLGRPVDYYTSIMTENGFILKSTAFINIRCSYYVCGAIRKLFNPGSRKEGEPLTRLAIFLQNITLPFTKVLDKIFRSKKDLARLEYVRIT